MDCPDITTWADVASTAICFLGAALILWVLNQ